MDEDKLESLYKDANKRLKAAKVGISIRKRGSKLSLRGKLPPKPGSNREASYQQTISLDVYANAAGIKVAEKKAQEMGAAIALGKFDWSKYTHKDCSIGSIGYWLLKFEEDYFNKRERNAKSETTWKDYQKIFNKLPIDAQLNSDNLLKAVLSTSPDTRTRKRACTYTKALANFTGIDYDPSKYAGNYSSSSVNAREIPTDREIQQWRDRIPNGRGWQYAFGLMAAYGLRNYELFYLDLESIKNSPGHLRIKTSKMKNNGEHTAWCLYPQWWEMWELGNIKQNFPQVTGKNNSALGDRVLKAFKRYGFHKPYNLRHAWAIRAINFIPLEMAARMMDHSVNVHTKTYQRWINSYHYDRMYQLMMSRTDLPIPPS